jgi:hypothetical protein
LWKELGDREALLTMNQIYPAGTTSVKAVNGWLANGMQWMNKPVPLPEKPQKLEPGKKVTIEIPVAAAVSTKPGLAASVTVRVLADDQAKAGPMVARLNDQQLAIGVESGKWIAFAAEPAMVKQGVNRLEVEMPAKADPINVMDAVLDIRYR